MAIDSTFFSLKAPVSTILSVRTCPDLRKFPWFNSFWRKDHSILMDKKGLNLCIDDILVNMYILNVCEIYDNKKFNPAKSVGKFFNFLNFFLKFHGFVDVHQKSLSGLRTDWSGPAACPVRLHLHNWWQIIFQLRDRHRDRCLNYDWDGDWPMFINRNAMNCFPLSFPAGTSHSHELSDWFRSRKISVSASHISRDTAKSRSWSRT